MKKLAALFLVFGLFASQSSFAAIEAHVFENKEQEKLYIKLTEELRCLVCQNQNIAGSNAELATDLRDKTYKLIMEDKNENEIKQWMLDRYGDFVLYNPPVKAKTLVLWVGPAVLFFIALFVVIRVGSKKNQHKDVIDKKQQQKIEALIKQQEEK